AGNLWLLELCLAKGAAAGAADACGWTALHWAAANGHSSAARRLVEAQPQAVLGAANMQAKQQQPSVGEVGSGVGARDCLGRIPLHWAALAGHHDAACVLVGAMQAAQLGLHVKDCAGVTPTQLAASRQHVRLVTLLLEAAYSGPHSALGGESESQLPGTTVATGQPQAGMLCAGHGLTALHLAAQNGLDT
ncbi:hypothetical protein MNEG_0648, partial [Monoraphidium neglectum]